ncbi:MAG: 3TM-type holin [Pseudomonadota bacterium]
MNILKLGDIIKGVGNIADDLFTSDEERLKIAVQEKAINAHLIQGQLAINAKEASHSSVFVAGWRPFIGWIGGLALAYQFVFYPLLVWVWALGQAQGWIPCHVDPGLVAQACTFATPPVLDSGALFAMLTGLLGIGGMRSFDKLKHTDTKRIF